MRNDDRSDCALSFAGYIFQTKNVKLKFLGDWWWDDDNLFITLIAFLLLDGASSQTKYLLLSICLSNNIDLKSFWWAVFQHNLEFENWKLF